MKTPYEYLLHYYVLEENEAFTYKGKQYFFEEGLLYELGSKQLSKGVLLPLMLGEANIFYEEDNNNEIEDVHECLNDVITTLIDKAQECIDKSILHSYDECKADRMIELCCSYTTLIERFIRIKNMLGD